MTAKAVMVLGTTSGSQGRCEALRTRNVLEAARG